MNYRNLSIMAVAASVFVIGCNQQPPIYEPTEEAIHNGSLYYSVSEANCKSCHGTDWKGSGPDAKGLTERGIKVPDFTAKPAPAKTVLDYFKAITVGTEKTKSLPSGHAFQFHTDRARWAMANFLFSLAKPQTTPKAIKTADEARLAALKEMQSAYSKERRWYMGDNKPSAEREHSSTVEAMLSKAGYTPTREISIVPVSDARRQATFEAQENQPQGYTLYRNNCQSCHGVFGEGAQGAVHLTSLPGTGEGVGGVPRLQPANASIRDLADSGQQVRTAHADKAAFGQKSPALTDEQWQILTDYIKSITGTQP